jgi:hypothetical protein
MREKYLGREITLFEYVLLIVKSYTLAFKILGLGCSCKCLTIDPLIYLINLLLEGIGYDYSKEEYNSIFKIILHLIMIDSSGISWDTINTFTGIFVKLLQKNHILYDNNVIVRNNIIAYLAEHIIDNLPGNHCSWDFFKCVIVAQSQCRDSSILYKIFLRLEIDYDTYFITRREFDFSRLNTSDFLNTYRVLNGLKYGEITINIPRPRYGIVFDIKDHYQSSAYPWSVHSTRPYTFKYSDELEMFNFKYMKELYAQFCIGKYHRDVTWIVTGELTPQFYHLLPVRLILVITTITNIWQLSRKNNWTTISSILSTLPVEMLFSIFNFLN